MFTDEQLQHLGQLVAKMVDIEKNTRGLYSTNWGFKTDIGLGASVLRLVNEVKGVDHVAD